MMSSGCVERADEGAVMRVRLTVGSGLWCGVYNCSVSELGVSVSWLGSGVTRIWRAGIREVPMATIQTRWIRRGALIRRMIERRARRAAAVRTVILGRRWILAPVPLTVVPPVAEDEHELSAQEVILALPAPNAPVILGQL
ncbi:hypothetical protein L1987_08831 [Smallanthus sonchifolius]|uniref:Uncharacterized protein n=1 Tax=Smallanthus sonchifolius TaxID=185202 RepID=A0ACB9JMA5_9ASTR|nr:hypothetical protein L1987_08831 [Smallanthus sonchifolius]